MQPDIVLGITKGPEVEFVRYYRSTDDADRYLVEVAEMLGVPRLANKAFQIPH